MQHSSITISMMLATALAYTATSCTDRCESEPVNSGSYVVDHMWSGPPGRDWLIGADVEIDREERLMTIRYTREGTTYEVRYTLTSTWS